MKKISVNRKCLLMAWKETKILLDTLKRLNATNEIVEELKTKIKEMRE